MFDPRELREPIVQAPLAGGPSTPELTTAVCQAGGLGFLAAGYRRSDAVRDEIAAVRAAVGDAPFGVNVFVPAPPGRPRPDASGLHAYIERLEHEATRQGAEVGEPRHDDDDWQQKLQVLRAERPAVASFTFGCPETPLVARLRDAGIAVWITVGTPDEARQAADAGADGLVVQGTEAGGHRGGFSDDPGESWGLLALLRVVARRVELPLIASGGIADGAAVAAVLCAGATAAQVGTALMLAPEAGTARAQRELLARPAPTRLTRAFTGRTARGIVNRFMEAHDDEAPPAYPEVHHATSPLRAAARHSGDADSFNLWAGQAHELTLERPAGEIVRELGAEARRVLRDLADQT